MADQTWQGRPLVDPEHSVDLEAAAAAGEFRDKLPRPAAEERAYQSYRRERALDACAHHLLGIRAAHAAGDAESAQAHGHAYAAAAGAAGFEPIQEPPREVLDRIEMLKPKVYTFRAHPADQLLSPPAEPEPQP
jgi:hypothetical protein